MSGLNWYSRIKSAREGANTQEVANWYKEANSSSNPYIFRKVPKSLRPLYFYIVEALDKNEDSFEKNKELQNEYIQYIKSDLIEILSDPNSNERDKILSAITNSIFSIKQDLTDNPILKIQDYCKFLPNGPELLEQKVSQRQLREYKYFFSDVLDIDSYFLDFIEHFDELLSQKIISEKILLELLGRPLSKIVYDPDEPIRMERSVEEIFHKLSKFLINIKEPSLFEDIFVKFQNYADFFPFSYSMNVSGPLITKRFLEIFIQYIQSVEKTNQKAYFKTLFDELVKYKNDGRVTNVTNLFDRLGLIAKADESQMFPTHTFRTDFSYKSEEFSTKGITQNEYNIIAQCFYEENKEFSGFDLLAKRTTTREELINSLLTNDYYIPKCKAKLASLGWKAIQEKGPEFKDKIEEEKRELRSNLINAVQTGDTARVEEILKKVNPFEFSREENPLAEAILYKKIDIVKLLINAGFDPKLKDDKGYTALLAAISHGSSDIVQYLLENSYSGLEEITDDGKTVEAILETMVDSPEKQRIIEIIEKEKRKRVSTGEKSTTTVNEENLDKLGDPKEALKETPVVEEEEENEKEKRIRVSTGEKSTTTVNEENKEEENEEEENEEEEEGEVGAFFSDMRNFFGFKGGNHGITRKEKKRFQQTRKHRSK